MTGYFLKAAAMAVIVVILTSLLKKQQASMAIVVSLAGCLALLFLFGLLLQPILRFLSTFSGIVEESQVYFLPVLKCTGIAIIAQICAAVCRDAGENALASAIELSGSALALLLALPLFTAFLELLHEWMGA